MSLIWMLAVERSRKSLTVIAPFLGVNLTALVRRFQMVWRMRWGSQETWLAALRAYPRLRDASNLRSWILTVAHHKAIDRIRARGRPLKGLFPAAGEEAKRDYEEWKKKRS